LGVRVIRMPSRIRLLFTCIVKGVNFKYPETLQESLVVDYLKNRWLTSEKLAVCYGFSEKKIIDLTREFVK
jgi:hypothetical protein